MSYWSHQKGLTIFKLYYLVARTLLVQSKAQRYEYVLFYCLQNQLFLASIYIILLVHLCNLLLKLGKHAFRLPTIIDNNLLQ